MPKEKLNVVKNDPDDDKFIEAAVEGDCDCIVSKDKKHLLKLKEFRGIKIISPEEFLKIINQENLVVYLDFYSVPVHLQFFYLCLQKVNCLCVVLMIKYVTTFRAPVLKVNCLSNQHERMH